MEFSDKKKDIPAEYEKIVNQRTIAKKSGNADYFRNMLKNLSTNQQTNI